MTIASVALDLYVFLERLGGGPLADGDLPGEAILNFSGINVDVLFDLNERLTIIEGAGARCLALIFFCSIVQSSFSQCGCHQLRSEQIPWRFSLSSQKTMSKEYQSKTQFNEVTHHLLLFGLKFVLTLTVFLMMMKIQIECQIQIYPSTTPSQTSPNIHHLTCALCSSRQANSSPYLYNSSPFLCRASTCSNLTFLMMKWSCSIAIKQCT